MNNLNPCELLQCLFALVTSPGSCESRNGALLYPQVFSPSASPQAYSDLPRILMPCKILQAPGQAVGRAGCLLAGQNIPSANPGPLLRDLGPSRCPKASSLSCLALNRIGNYQMKTKGKESIEIITVTSTLFCYLSYLSVAAL